MVVTKLRENLRSRALRIQKYREPNQEDGIGTKTRLQFRDAHGNYDHKLLETRKALKRITRAPTPTLLRKKGKYRKLSLFDKVEAVHMVMVDKKYQVAVAKHF